MYGYFERIDAINYRKKKYEEKCRKLIELVSGVEWDYVSHKLNQGKLMFKKGGYGQFENEFPKEIIECIEKYIQYDAYIKFDAESLYFSIEADEWLEKMSGVLALDNEEKEFYEAFIYIVMGLAIEDGTWKGVLKKISTPFGYSEEEKFFKSLIFPDVTAEVNCLLDPSFDPSSCGCEDTPFLDKVMWPLKRVYRLVTGEDLSSLLMEDEECRRYAEEIRKRLTEGSIPNIKIADLPEPPEWDEDDNLYEENMYQAYQEMYDPWPKFDEESANESIENLDEIYRQYFSDIEYFKQCCKTLLTKSAAMFNSRNVKEEIENGINLYLDKLKASSWLKDDKFFDSYIYLDKVYALIERVICDADLPE
ncbi:hypothetical protein SAMN02910384_02112 [Pseudobutyrivibrio sp. ACV-2]|uniref:hypothetical protein n=1 Tax=Pseudobutyrivibrio sp. ACV-2 TaxID=1520801 RepID=UPI000896F9E9|nr:hypothetical protein [Pseudobutyrivibrio sp. ACV-2]SEA70803.1 hypothetical protein SAMN02910384_02112 [Pseudobutyrivibrio sp. ACV-2]